MGFQRSQISKMSLSDFQNAWNDGLLDLIKEGYQFSEQEGIEAGNFTYEDKRKKKKNKKMKRREKSPDWKY